MAFWKGAVWYQSDGGAQLLKRERRVSIGADVISRSKRNTRTSCWWKEDLIWTATQSDVGGGKSLRSENNIWRKNVCFKMLTVFPQLSLTVRGSPITLIFYALWKKLFHSYDVSFWHLSLTVLLCNGGFVLSWNGKIFVGTPLVALHEIASVLVYWKRGTGALFKPLGHSKENIYIFSCSKSNFSCLLSSFLDVHHQHHQDQVQSPGQACALSGHTLFGLPHRP